MMANLRIIGKQFFGSRARRHGLPVQPPKAQLLWEMFQTSAQRSLCLLLEKRLRELFKVMDAEL